MKANRDQNVCHRHQHCFNNFKDCVCAIPAWGGFLPADLKSHINGFLRRLQVWLYINCVQCRTTEDCRWQLVTCSNQIKFISGDKAHSTQTQMTIKHTHTHTHPHPYTHTETCKKKVNASTKN